MQRLTAWAKSSAVYQARIGARISDDRGQSVPTPPSGAIRSWVCSGTLMPAMSAIFVAGWPTMSGCIDLRSGSKATRSSLAVSSLERK